MMNLSPTVTVLDSRTHRVILSRRFGGPVEIKAQSLRLIVGVTTRLYTMRLSAAVPANSAGRDGLGGRMERLVRCPSAPMRLAAAAVFINLQQEQPHA